MPVLLNMKRSSDEKEKWEGKVYNAENGKTYEANIQLKSANALRVEGCLMGRFAADRRGRALSQACPAFNYGPAAETGAAGAPEGASA